VSLTIIVNNGKKTKKQKIKINKFDPVGTLCFEQYTPCGGSRKTQ